MNSAQVGYLNWVVDKDSETGSKTASWQPRSTLVRLTAGAMTVRRGEQEQGKQLVVKCRCPSMSQRCGFCRSDSALGNPDKYPSSERTKKPELDGNGIKAANERAHRVVANQQRQHGAANGAQTGADQHHEQRLSVPPLVPPPVPPPVPTPVPTLGTTLATNPRHQPVCRDTQQQRRRLHDRRVAQRIAGELNGTA